MVPYQSDLQGSTGTAATMDAGTAADPITRWPLFAYLGGAMVCLLTSSVCHLILCHSERTAYVTLRLDYAGIAALIVTSFYPLAYYSFLCDPALRRLYMDGRAMALGTRASIAAPVASGCAIAARGGDSRGCLSLREADGSGLRRTIHVILIGGFGEWRRDISVGEVIWCGFSNVYDGALVEFWILMSGAFASRRDENIVPSFLIVISGQ
ncbi:unnamed protein product [Miscanthus lutarioriparius]|uniref:Uncharacterized protein n=1 Tax=Miscanthus lutarioriparius TaxID=422564 RepID=A0A811RZA0_9POAL|nr:unnamed protein product [Miscanthus lutarioriparius]